MALTLGARFGAYAIAEPIGTGGMGEVYRATDTNLKRDVAIKVLPPAFASDTERLARFQREAEVLASLNHSNIAHVYGLERSDGVTALAMELVDGPTLAERIAQGPIPVDEAVSIALQIVAALEAAHARGIVHRDLKPANVKLRSDGSVKVLDFGIARARDSRNERSGDSIAHDAGDDTSGRRARHRRLHEPGAGAWQDRRSTR
jgi:serine/threonine protein kinase